MSHFEHKQATRIWHGPGEASREGSLGLKSFAIDLFEEHAWVTHWGTEEEVGGLEEVQKFLLAKGIFSAVILHRPEKGLPKESQVLFGAPPVGRIEVRENGMRFWVQLLGTRHAGLFLDHAPLRDWLKRNTQGLRILNTFSYTGSLSVAAGVGGASEVLNLDLSKPALVWAKENWELNGLPTKSLETVSGDVFEWLPRFYKQGRKFDCVILDPPSFSRGKRGSFSTSKDLVKLHRLALDLLVDGGILVTSINSSNISVEKFRGDINTALNGKKVKILHRIELPPTFPNDDYLKGFCFRVER